MKNYLIITLSAYVFAGCGTTKNMDASQKESVHATWQLTLLEGKTIGTKTPVTLNLTKDNKVSGFAGCNRITGTYQIENSYSITFSNLATTRMTCPDQAVENEVLEALKTVNYCTVENNQLVMTVGRRAPMLTFTKISYPEIVNRYWKLVELDGKGITMADNQEREQYFILRNDGTVKGFAGCNTFNGGYEANGFQIKFNPNMAVTAKICPDVKIDESAFLKVFKEANNYSINKDRLTLNAGKRMPLAVFEAVYF